MSENNLHDKIFATTPPLNEEARGALHAILADIDAVYLSSDKEAKERLEELLKAPAF